MPALPVEAAAQPPQPVALKSVGALSAEGSLRCLHASQRRPIVHTRVSLSIDSCSDIFIAHQAACATARISSMLQ